MVGQTLDDVLRSFKEGVLATIDYMVAKQDAELRHMCDELVWRSKGRPADLKPELEDVGPPPQPAQPTLPPNFEDVDLTAQLRSCRDNVMAALHEKLARQRAQLCDMYVELERTVDGQPACQEPRQTDVGSPPQQALPIGLPVGEGGSCSRHPKSHREDGSLQAEQPAGSPEKAALINPHKRRCVDTGPSQLLQPDLWSWIRHATGLL